MRVEPFLIVRDHARFLALEAEWDDLWARTRQKQFSHCFAWFHIGWETTGLPRKRQMHILVVRREGQAVLIWPLALRRRLAWCVAAALGPEFTEYDPVLVADGPDSIALLQAAWNHVQAHCPADLVIVQHARVGTAMRGLLDAGQQHPGEVDLDACQVIAETLPSPYISWEGFDSWDDYWKSRSKNTRNGYTRRWRRFADLGAVTFEAVEGAQEFETLLAWSLAHKIAWMDRTGLDNDFMRTPEFAAFLRTIGTTPTAGGRLIMFALKLDGRTVATKIGTIDDRRYEGFISSLDPEYGAFSTGTIIMVECLKWLFAKGLKYDFRIGDEAYKRDWATHDRPATTFHLINRRGGLRLLQFEAGLLHLRQTKDRLRVGIPPHYRQWLKARLGGDTGQAAGAAGGQDQAGAA
eukprot:gene10328-10394_t